MLGLRKARQIHRCCGQLCGQAAATRRQAARNLARPWIAEIFSTKKPLKINCLSNSDKAVTPTMARQGASLLAVEFSRRVSIGAAHG
jgi:hypothetical protein